MEKPFTVWYHWGARGPEPLKEWYPGGSVHRDCPDLIKEYFMFDQSHLRADEFVTWMKRRHIHCWFVGEQYHPMVYEYVFAPIDVAGFRAELDRDWPGVVCSVYYSF